MNNEIHECEFKKGKMWDIEENAYGKFFCRRCFVELEPKQIHSEALKYHGRNR